MVLTLKSTEPNFTKRLQSALDHKFETCDNVRDIAGSIINDVRQNGDNALYDYTKRFDKVDIQASELSVDSTDIESAWNCCPADIKDALTLSARRIEDYHTRQVPKNVIYTDETGTELGWQWTAIDSVGLYTPGGLAAYPSTVLMNAIPARIAGVKRIVMVAPPKPDDKNINTTMLAAAHVAGIKEIYKVGGAQAIAALAYGTDTIPPVKMIVGPGNAYVTEAKRQVFGKVGIDMIAGPSEILILADSNNNPDWIAADLLSQAEHDTAARSVLITDSASFAEQVINAVKKILSTLPRRDIAEKSWEDNGIVAIVQNMDEAIDAVNQVATEHLELAVDDAHSLLPKIRNAGAIFIGRHTPEAVGDYTAGPSHVLPTAGSAAFSSGLGVFTFLKRSSLIACTPESLAAIADPTATLAKSEGLTAHELSVTIRQK